MNTTKRYEQILRTASFASSAAHEHLTFFPLQTPEHYAEKLIDSVHHLCTLLADPAPPQHHDKEIDVAVEDTILYAHLLHVATKQKG